MVSRSKKMVLYGYFIPGRSIMLCFVLAGNEYCCDLLARVKGQMPALPA